MLLEIKSLREVAIKGKCSLHLSCVPSSWTRQNNIIRVVSSKPDDRIDQCEWDYWYKDGSIFLIIHFNSIYKA